MDGNDRSTHEVARIALQIKRWLLAALGLGFFGLTADVFMEHYFTMHSMRYQQWIPVAFAPLAGIVALATAWRFDAVTLRLFSAASWISIAVGGLGLYFHANAVVRNLESFTDWQTLLAVLPHSPPLGAPAAFVGTGALGLLAHTCALKLETVLVGRGATQPEPTLQSRGLFAVAFVLLVLAPLMPVLIHWLF